MRRPLLLALSVLATTAACTSLLGDFTVKTTTSDGGHVGDDGSSSGGDGGACNAQATGSTVYLGQLATLDGTKSTTTTGDPVTYSWTVDTVPMGSMIETSNLTGGSTATPSFVPDVLGDYQLVLSVTAGGCPASNAPATVTARLPQVLYAKGTVTASGPQATYVVADLDGGTPHPVMCADSVVTSVTNEIATFAAYSGRAYDFWEAPAGQPSNYAAFTVDYQAGNYSTHLFAGTTVSGCDASPPVDLGAAGFGPSPFGSEPRFSPNGSRFAVYDAAWHVLTYGANGTGQHAVSQYSANQNGTATFDTLGRGSSYNVPPRLAWTASGSAVAWARSNATTGGWEVVTANDQIGATPTVYMSCPGVTPREIALLKDGSVIASYRATATSGENIYQLTLGSGTACQVKHQYTSVSDAASAIATDFDVSPDFSTLAFLQLDPTTQDASLWNLAPSSQYPGGYVYTVSINDSAPPHQLSPKPALFGPRWIGGGTLLVFTGLDATPDAQPPKTSIVVIAPDGGGQTTIAQGDGVTTFVSTSGNAACAVVAGKAGPFGAALVALIALAALVRGRRRRD